MRSSLLLLLTLAIASPAFSQAIVMTGDVQADFPASNYFPDSTSGCDVVLPPQLADRPCGWDIQGVAISYDHVWDVLYVGVDFSGVAGDADGDGDPNGTGPVLQSLGGVDQPFLGGSESVIVGIDANDDGVLDILVGNPLGANLTGACTADFVPGMPDIRQAFGALRPVNQPEVIGGLSAQQPDIEFSIPGFSWISYEFTTAGQQNLGFYVWAGSDDDASIGHDATSDTGTTTPQPIIILPCFPIDNQYEFIGVEIFPGLNEVTFRYGLRRNYGCCILFSFFQNANEIIPIPGNPTINVGNPGLQDLGFIDLGVPVSNTQPVDCKDTSLFFEDAVLAAGQNVYLQVVAYPGTGSITNDFLSSNVLTYTHF